MPLAPFLVAAALIVSLPSAWASEDTARKLLADVFTDRVLL